MEQNALRLIEAWKALAPYLELTGGPNDNDSPVAVVMDMQQWGKVSRRSVRDRTPESASMLSRWRRGGAAA